MPVDELRLHPICGELGLHPTWDKAQGGASAACDKLCPLARSDRVACVRR